MENLKFKVILGTIERREAFLKAIKKAGVNGNIIDADFIAGANFAWWDYDFLENSFVYNTSSFCSSFEDCDYPLIRLDNAIARLEKYAASLQPEFNIKPGDDVLVRSFPLGGNMWRLARFSGIREDDFMCETPNYHMIAYKGNESLIGTTNIADYWRVENGKPVFVKGESK